MSFLRDVGKVFNPITPYGSGGLDLFGTGAAADAAKAGSNKAMKLGMQGGMEAMKGITPARNAALGYLNPFVDAGYAANDRLMGALYGIAPSNAKAPDPASLYSYGDNPNDIYAPNNQVPPQYTDMYGQPWQQGWNNGGKNHGDKRINPEWVNWAWSNLQQSGTPEDMANFLDQYPEAIDYINIGV